MGTFIVGQRVKVKIANPHQWAPGAAESFNGKAGVVAVVKPAGQGMADRCLVTLDEPAKPWWAAQSPPKHWHFDFTDLVPES